jgi:hypothetical protein
MRGQTRAGVNTAVITAGLSRAGLAAHSGVCGRVASYCRGLGWLLAAARGR